ncbi:MAG TPA: ABC transporter permease, partial [Cutibacterium acnes]|nr:ABC transporter permease [Cutibacterium acnes]
AAIFLVWADTFSRTVFSPAELPIGVITGLLGAPFLLVLVKRGTLA